MTLSLTFAAITAMRQAMRDIRTRGGIDEVMARNDSWDSVLDLVGLETIREWDARYGLRRTTEPSGAPPWQAQSSLAATIAKVASVTAD